MLELIYKETKATKARPAVRFVYGFTRLPSVAPAQIVDLNRAAAVPGKVGELARKELVKLQKTETVKGAAVLAVLQNAHRIQLSKGEKAYLLREMRLLAENAGETAEALLKAA